MNLARTAADPDKERHMWAFFVGGTKKVLKYFLGVLAGTLVVFFIVLFILLTRVQRAIESMTSSSSSTELVNAEETPPSGK